MLSDENLSKILNTDSFWDFSIRIYGKPGIKDCLLGLQNTHGCDINLILLFCWLEKYSLHLSKINIMELLKASKYWQEDILIPARNKRRMAKGSPDYNSLKAAELALEKKEQKALMNLVTGPFAERGKSRLAEYLTSFGCKDIKNIISLLQGKNE